jgi:hypothetical protein
MNLETLEFGAAELAEPFGVLTARTEAYGSRAALKLPNGLSIQGSDFGSGTLSVLKDGRDIGSVFTHDSRTRLVLGADGRSQMSALLSNGSAIFAKRGFAGGQSLRADLPGRSIGTSIQSGRSPEFAPLTVGNVTVSPKGAQFPGGSFELKSSGTGIRAANWTEGTFVGGRFTNHGGRARVTFGREGSEPTSGDPSLSATGIFLAGRRMTWEQVGQQLRGSEWGE